MTRGLHDLVTRGLQSPLLEARSLAQIQVVDELVDGFDSENRTSRSDGTSKKGHSFITFDIVNDAGKTSVAGVHEVSSGDAQSQLQVLENILEDVCAMFVRQNDGKDKEDRAMNKTLKRTKNVMSDGCAVQKKFNYLFTSYRKELLNEWESSRSASHIAHHRLPYAGLKCQKSGLTNSYLKRTLTARKHTNPSAEDPWIL